MGFGTAATASTTASTASSFDWGQLASAVGQTAGLVTSMQAAKQQAANANAAIEAQNAANEANATAAEMQARSALKVGAAEEQRQMLKIAQLKSDQRAAMAARGLSLEEGSPENILASTDFMGSIDLKTIRENAQQQAWGYREQAANYKAANRKASASPSKAAATALLTVAPAVAKGWLKLKESYSAPDAGLASNATYANNDWIG